MRSLCEKALNEKTNREIKSRYVIFVARAGNLKVNTVKTLVYMIPAKNNRKIQTFVTFFLFVPFLGKTSYQERCKLALQKYNAPFKIVK